MVSRNGEKDTAMNRREFFAMASAAAATIALPGVASANGVSGLINGKRFVLTEPMVVKVNGPVILQDCEIIVLFPCKLALTTYYLWNPDGSALDWQKYKPEAALTFIVPDYESLRTEIRGCKLSWHMAQDNRPKTQFSL